MEDNLKKRKEIKGRRPKEKEKKEDDLKKKMEDKPINSNQPNWL